MNLMKKIRCMNVAGIREWVQKGTPLQDALCFITYYYQLISCVLTMSVACEHTHSGSPNIVMVSRCYVNRLLNLNFHFHYAKFS